MAISDKQLPLDLKGNLNKTEMDLMLENLSQEEQLALKREMLGNLNKTEMDLLQESEPGSFSNIREMIGKLIASGAPTRKILDIMTALTPMGQRQLMNLIGETLASGDIINAVKSREDTSIGNAAIQSRDYEDVPINRFNKGGIVSLKHLTRPL
jgi:hypothetical protein